jgi:uncharacterized protein YqiB (DUF1249 family)
MRDSGKQIIHPGVRARDLPALMELYELNYIQLRQLVPDFGAVQDHSVSKVDRGMDLCLTIRERCKYTTTLNLTYHFSACDESNPAPDVVVRLYHDAQVAEVISRGRGRRHPEYDRFHHDYPLHIKWQANRFLHKWLAYCLNQGHSFSPAREQLAEALESIECERAVSLES